MICTSRDKELFKIQHFDLCDLDLWPDLNTICILIFSITISISILNMKSLWVAVQVFKLILKSDMLTSVTLTFNLTFIKFAYSCSTSIGLYAHPIWWSRSLLFKVIWKVHFFFKFWDFELSDLDLSATQIKWTKSYSAW